MKEEGKDKYMLISVDNGIKWKLKRPLVMRVGWKFCTLPNEHAFRHEKYA
jgi:hypothetical protein